MNVLVSLWVLSISLLLLHDRIESVECLSVDATSNPKKPPLQWLIVGGGPHGVHIATRLLEEVPSLQHSNLCIVDDDPQLLHKWKTRTAATGMTHLRSSASYHLDVREDSLKRYATEKEERHSSNSSRKSRTRQRRRRRPRTTSSSSSPPPNNGLFAPDYQRPLLPFFNQHCDHVVDKYRLEETHLQGMVTHIDPQKDCVVVQIQRPQGDIVETRAENIVLALGSGNLAYPDWVDPQTLESGQVRHIFDLDIDNNHNNNDHPSDADESTTHKSSLLKKEDHDTPTTTTDSASRRRRRHRSIAVVGGGISAAHLALKLEREASSSANHNHQNHNDNDNDNVDTTIHMICRHDLREQQFDTHQDWMMDSYAGQRSQKGGGQGLPERQRHFASVNSLVERRQIIQRERQAGTVSASVSRGTNGLRYAIQKERIQWHKGDILHCSSNSSSRAEQQQEEESRRRGDGPSRPISLSLTSGDTVVVDQVILATGFGKRPPGHFLLEHMARQHPECKLGACGYPAPDKNLRWHERIYVAGALAELELGPSARNIAGARLASERIVAAAVANTSSWNHNQQLAAAATVV